MKRSGTFVSLTAVLIVVLTLFAVAPMMGDMPSAEAAVADPATIVNIANRRDNFTKQDLYTVPSGQTLVIQGMFISGFADLVPGQALPVAFTLKCDNQVLIPAEVMGSFALAAPAQFGELGLVCEAGKTVKLVGGPDPTADTVGWMIIGVLVPTP